jgi:hypothetical protein
MAMRRRLAQTFKNEMVFKIGVICLGLSPVAIVLAFLFFR